MGGFKRQVQRVQPVLNGHRFRQEFPELLAPSRGNNLHQIGDKGFTTEPTDQAKLVVGRGADGSKQVLIVFPKVGTCFAIRSASELKKWRDGFDAIIDQIARPGLEAL